MIKAISYGAPSGRKDKWDINNMLKVKYYKPDLEIMKELGVTHIRVYTLLPLEFYLEAAWQGFQILQQLPGLYHSANFSSLQELEAIKKIHKDTIHKLNLQPNIAAYIPWNDVPYTWYSPYSNIVNRWGFDVCDNFLKEIVANIKEVSDVPVMSSNLFNSEKRNMSGDELGFNYVDIIGVNSYFGVDDWTSGEFSEELLQEQMKKLKAVQDKYQKPILISETGFSSYWGEQKQADCLKLQMTAALKEFEAVCVFEFNDEVWKKPIFKHEGNWGLVSEDRKVKKIAFETVKGIFNGS